MTMKLRLPYAVFEFGIGLVTSFAAAWAFQHGDMLAAGVLFLASTLPYTLGAYMVNDEPDPEQNNPAGPLARNDGVERSGRPIHAVSQQAEYRTKVDFTITSGPDR